MSLTATHERLDVRLPAVPASVPELRRAAADFAAAQKLPDCHAVALAVTEAATNVVVHAYRERAPGLVRLVMCAQPDRLVVVVRDWGGGMRPRTDSPGLGLGLPTIAHLASEFQVEAADGQGTLVRLHFHRGQAVSSEPLAVTI